MKRYKVRFISLIAMVALFIGALFSAVFSTFNRNASALGEYAPTAVFSATSGSTVGKSAETGDAFIQLEMGDKAVVNYRHDLALKWFQAENTPTYFSLKLQFPELKFEKFTIQFESAQENITKNGTTKNAIVFTNAEGTVTVHTENGEKEDVVSSTPVPVSNPTAELELMLTSAKDGNFTVACNEETNVIGELTNIGGYYIEYLSSASSTPRIPLAFQADGVATDEKQLVTVLSLNGQEMKVVDEKGKDIVKDNVAPALVVNEEVYSFPLGQKFSLSYLAIDVLDDTITVTRDYDFFIDEETELDYKSLSTSTYLQAQTSGSEKELVSIRFQLKDDRDLDASAPTEYVYLAWYCPNAESKTVKTETVSFIPVDRTHGAPAYTCITEGSNSSVLDKANADYLAYVTAVAEASENVNAGEGAYFYLPSLRSLIKDVDTDYRNLKFSIYYKHQNSSSGVQSATSLNYNGLRFEVSKPGNYTFRVVATDSLSNEMKVYDEHGKLVTVNSSNVFELDCIPEFTFSASSKGATIEETKEQTIGYLDTTYTISAFDVVALAGYREEYKLYYFDQDAYLADGKSLPTYSSMVSDPTQIDKKYLVEIQEYDATITEEDTAWDKTDNDVEWKSSTRTFRPRQAGFYFVELEVTDADLWQHKATAYQVIEVRNPIDEIKGETYWLENNVTAVVLFAISAVLLVAIVVLWLVKPSDKKVEEVDITELKGRKKK